MLLRRVCHRRTVVVGNADVCGGAKQQPAAAGRQQAARRRTATGLVADNPPSRPGAPPGGTRTLVVPHAGPTTWFCSPADQRRCTCATRRRRSPQHGVIAPRSPDSPARRPAAKPRINSPGAAAPLRACKRQRLSIQAAMRISAGPSARSCRRCCWRRKYSIPTGTRSVSTRRRRMTSGCDSDLTCCWSMSAPARSPIRSTTSE